MSSRPRLGIVHNMTLQHHHPSTQSVGSTPCTVCFHNQTDATPLPVVAPVPILENAHAHMDRFEQRMRRMRVSNEAISWDDFDEAPVASLPTQFRMPDIERYMGIDASHRRNWDDLTQEFLRQFAFNVVIDVSRRELEKRALLEDCGPSLPLLTQKGRSPQDDRDQKMWVILVQQDRDLSGFKETSYFIPLAPSPTDCYSSCIEIDMTVFPARYAFESSFPEAHEGWFVDSVGS
ncbi:hypothetical protein CK203_042603 [Vitis vinifera]|uniref:Uncharacterized protein n=1 Tax=Vitis vinifera TaxID=29760 RepID=A0A438I830_VITVI|nr:hypothetical protein CK203_042603 [Vitis vinifera]